MFLFHVIILHNLFKQMESTKNINSNENHCPNAIKCLPIREFEFLNVHQGGAGANLNALYVQF